MINLFQGKTSGKIERWEDRKIGRAMKIRILNLRYDEQARFEDRRN